MISLFKKTMLATALAATALAGSAPAMADGYHGGGYGGYHHGGGDGAGLAIGAGIVGLAIGAIVASNAHHDDRYDRNYYPNREYRPSRGYVEGGYYGAPYAQRDWAWHDGYYYDRDGNRFGRDGRPCGHDDRGYARRGYDEREGWQGGYRGY